jgi:hypothetical protein
LSILLTFIAEILLHEQLAQKLLKVFNDLCFEIAERKKDHAIKHNFLREFLKIIMDNLTLSIFCHSQAGELWYGGYPWYVKFQNSEFIFLFLDLNIVTKNAVRFVLG